jgi:hypothetical protein
MDLTAATATSIARRGADSWQKTVVATHLRSQKLRSSDEVGRTKLHTTNRLRPTPPPGLPLVSDVRYYCANRCLRRHERVLARLFLGHWGVFYVDC